jgi:heptosyltransferase-2
VERLAVVAPSWVGDTVMATPVLRAARAHLPGARIAVLVRPGLAAVLDGTTWCDETITVRMKGGLGPLRVAGALRRFGAGAVLLLPNSLRSAIGPRLAGTPVRVGYRRDGRGPLLTHALDPPPPGPVPAVDYYRRLAGWAFGRDDPDPAVELATTPEEEAAADRLLEPVSGPFVVLNPGANRADKRWPAARFAAVADRLAAACGTASVVTGAPREADLARAVAEAARTPVTDLVARGVTLGPLKAVLRRAALLVTNDTGPRHLAAALGTPAVALFGPTDHRWTTLTGANERILLAEPFLPDGLEADRHADACPIDRIAVGDVVSASRDLLEPPRHR